VALPRPDGASIAVQIGLAAVRVEANAGGTTDAGWTSNDFFVPPSLWGAGFGWYFLSGLLNALSASHQECYVVVKAVPHDAQHKVALDDHRSFIEQYRKIGFRQQNAAGTAPRTGANERLLQELGYQRREDTLFRLDLAQWKERRGEP
jgi:hypothetical protein